MKRIAHYLPVILLSLSTTPCFSVLKQDRNSNVSGHAFQAFNDSKNETIDDGFVEKQEQYSQIKSSYNKSNIVLTPEDGKEQNHCAATTCNILSC